MSKFVRNSDTQGGSLFSITGNNLRLQRGIDGELENYLGTRSRLRGPALESHPTSVEQFLLFVGEAWGGAGPRVVHVGEL